jgi:O-antigen chain-terminating methyltransferase
MAGALASNGFDPMGVDQDEGMLTSCRELQSASGAWRSLNISDAARTQVLNWYQGFHIAEHLPFADLQQLVQEALRVLTHSGLLILEVSNAENLVVTP